MHQHATHSGLVIELIQVLLPALLLASYLLAVARNDRTRRAWSRWRTAGFVTGIALLSIGLALPLLVRTDDAFRLHMLQHLLIGMLAPLGLVLGTPVTLALRTLPVSASRRVTAFLRQRPFHWISHPVTAMVLNVGGMYVLYATPLYLATMESAVLHHLIHFHFLAAGYLFTWAISGSDPGPERPSRPVRLGILFVSIAAHGVLAKMMYAYGWPTGSPYALEQIQSAAKLMYYGGDVAELLLVVAFFATWYPARHLPARAV